MIVSHKWRFVFIKTRRTAGSAIEAALAPLLGPEDIITGSKLDGVARRNCEETVTGHIGWRQIAALAGPVVWKYRRICVERNPWDKALSDWRWHREVLGTTRLGLADFILALRRSDWPRYAKGARPVAEVLDYAGLDFAALCRSLGLPAVALPRLKANAARGAQGARHDAASSAAVREVFAREIAHFGYREPEGGA